MKDETIVKIVTIIVVCCIAMGIGLIMKGHFEAFDAAVDNCKSKGYEGIKFEGIMAESYRCWRKQQTESGYEYEYSGIFD